jgi:hypothetical protein
VNQEIIRAKAIIAELRLNNDKAHQLTHTLSNLLTSQWLLLEQVYRPGRSTLRRGNLSVSRSVVSATNVTEKEPPKPPPDEDEPNPPIKEPPTEEPPVKEPPPKSR